MQLDSVSRMDHAVPRAALVALAVLTIASCAPAPRAASDAGASGDAQASDAAIAIDAGPPPIDASLEPDAGEEASCDDGLDQPEACDACLRTECCAETARCQSTTGCPVLFACLHACPSGDGSCWITCLEAADGNAAAASSEVDRCIANACPPECRAM